MMAEDDSGPRSEDERLGARLAEVLCLMRDRHLALQGTGGPDQPPD
jgi:hypothetical protein